MFGKVNKWICYFQGGLPIFYFSFILLTPVLSPVELELFLGSKLPLDGEVRSLNDHVLEPGLTEQVGHAGSVAERVDGPTVLYRVVCRE